MPQPQRSVPNTAYGDSGKGNKASRAQGDTPAGSHPVYVPSSSSGNLLVNGEAKGGKRSRAQTGKSRLHSAALTCCNLVYSTAFQAALLCVFSVLRLPLTFWLLKSMWP